MFADIDENKLFHGDDFAYYNLSFARLIPRLMDVNICETHHIYETDTPSIQKMINYTGSGMVAKSEIKRNKVNFILRYFKSKLPDIKFRYKFDKVPYVQTPYINGQNCQVGQSTLYNCSNLIVYTNYNFILTIKAFHVPFSGKTNSNSFHRMEITPLSPNLFKTTDNKPIQFDLHLDTQHGPCNFELEHNQNLIPEIVANKPCSTYHVRLKRAYSDGNFTVIDINKDWNLQKMVHPCVYIDYLTENPDDIQFTKLVNSIQSREAAFEAQLKTAEDANDNLKTECDVLRMR
jgi:hypothetical protein